jgi:hypothetical protein
MLLAAVSNMRVSEKVRENLITYPVLFIDEDSLGGFKWNIVSVGAETGVS